MGNMTSIPQSEISEIVQAEGDGLVDGASGLTTVCPPSPEWYPLEESLQDLLHVVPQTSGELERTTILTWMYLNHGVITFEDLALRVEGDLHKTVKKKLARRAMRGLVRIGAISLFTMQQASNQADTLPEADADSEASEDGGLAIGKFTAAHITRDGMTWMRRAWTARAISMKNPNAGLEWIHKVYLQEEEEGKGNEPHWIERLGGSDSGGTLVPVGEVSSWIGASVTSVFDLSSVVMRRSRAR